MKLGLGKHIRDNDGVGAEAMVRAACRRVWTSTNCLLGGSSCPLHVEPMPLP